MLKKKKKKKLNIKKIIKISLLGRPNVGKSTFFNKIIGFNRSITSKTSETTRDPIYHQITWGKYHIIMNDSAGTKKKNKTKNKIEYLCFLKTLNAIKECSIVFLILDASSAMKLQDLKLINLILSYNKLPLIIVNKLDLIKNKIRLTKDFQYFITNKISQFKNVTVIYLSSKKAINTNLLFTKTLSSWNNFYNRIETKELNKWLLNFMKNNYFSSEKIKIKHINQYNTCPPKFNLFFNKSSRFRNEEQLKKNIKRSLLKNFQLQGTPIDIKFTYSYNPYKH